jgi:hypothetical protein
LRRFPASEHVFPIEDVEWESWLEARGSDAGD